MVGGGYDDSYRRTTSLVELIHKTYRFHQKRLWWKDNKGIMRYGRSSSRYTMNKCLCCKVECVFVFLLVAATYVCLQGSSRVDAAVAPPYPHAKNFKRNAWEEYNLGALSQLEIIFDLPPNYGPAVEPSHVRLCRALIAPDKLPLLTADGKKQRVLVINEEQDTLGVCTDSKNPYQSLLRMFASSLVAHVAHIVGRTNIFYQHNCGVKMATTSQILANWVAGTIQQFLPPYLKINLDKDSEEAVVPIVTQSCSRCIAEFEALAKSGQPITLDNTFPDCLFFPTKASAANTASSGLTRHLQKQRHSSAHPSTVQLFKALIQPLRKNLRMAAEEWRDILQAMEGDQLWWGKLEKSQFKDFNKFNMDGAIIYLDCDVGDCSHPNAKGLAIPLHVYASELSRSVNNVAIFMTASCSNHPCSEYASGVKNFLDQYLPHKYVTLEVIQGNTAYSYSRMTLAFQLFGPPTVGSIIPFLSKAHYGTVIQSPALYPWMDSLIQMQEYNMLTHAQQLGGLHYLSSVLVPVLETPYADLENFMRQPIHNSLRTVECPEIRGRMGKWVQDMRFAANVAQYVSPIIGYAGDADYVFKYTTQEGKFRKPTTYRWEDAFDSSCPTQFIDRAGFCILMYKMEIERVMFVGDSLTFHWSQSFWKLMQHTNTPGNDTVLHWDDTLNCTALGAGLKNVKVVFIRNDQLDGTKDLPLFGRPNCFLDRPKERGYCHAWQDRYIATKAPTLLLVNTGAHQHKEKFFHDDIIRFVDFVDAQNRSSDVVLIRTTSPGHQHCKNFTEPFPSYWDYARHAVVEERYILYDWDKFLPYNYYIDWLLNRRRYKEKTLSGFRNAKKEPKITIELLDIYPMTVLRPDGHLTGADNSIEEFLNVKCKNCRKFNKRKEDCLHYSLPGPIDWWSHLMFSNLKDIFDKKILETLDVDTAEKNLEEGENDYYD